MKVRGEACSACPYRQDVPSGVWAAEEYDKLVGYDRPMHEQPHGSFACHATPDHYCHGWAVVGSWDLLALRMASFRSDDPIEIPEPSVPLFKSHTAAAEHGRADIEAPSDEAIDTVQRLTRKHKRLR